MADNSRASKGGQMIRYGHRTKGPLFRTTGSLM